jgi:hypothetical protein
MNSTHLKTDVINIINNLKDVHIVEEIKMLLDFELEEKLFHLSSEQMDRIEKGRNEYLNSQTLTEEEANSEIDLWLKEK